MRKVLFTAKVDSHILNFHIPYLKWFKENGFEVHVACNGDAKIPYADVKYNLDFDRNPLKPSNFKVYLKLKKIINENGYDIIHCHTPIGGALTRFASRKARKKGTKVIYTVHGFHFLKGGAKSSWIIFYPVEKFLSKFTDCLITINEEDYSLALNRGFKAGEICLVNGVGVDLKRFYPASSIEERDSLRQKLGLNKDEYILIYVAELNHNKHQDLVINAVKLLKDSIPEIRLLLVGEGVMHEDYEKMVKDMGLEECITLLGQRNDVDKLLRASDVALSASRREGLPRNIMEAMATGLPIVLTGCRGNRDLVENGKNGYVVGIDDYNDMAKKIMKIYDSQELSKEFGREGMKMVEEYSLDKVAEKMASIYRKYM